MSRLLPVEIARPYYPQADPVHGFEHILRVLRTATYLAELEQADVEIVTAAALLHDAQDPQTDDHPDQRSTHQHASAELAQDILLAEGWSSERIHAVLHCIRAHRFRDDREPPTSLEARILFDADKLDAIGAIGVARAIGYALRAGQPFYAPASPLFLKTGQAAPGEAHSAYHEYLFKLRKLKHLLYTATARQMAEKRQSLMESYFTQLASECEGLD
jgi:uncharacterized protein